MSKNIYTERTHMVSNRSLKNHEKSTFEIPELKRGRTEWKKMLTEVEEAYTETFF